MSSPEPSPYQVGVTLRDDTPDAPVAVIRHTIAEAVGYALVMTAVFTLMMWIICQIFGPRIAPLRTIYPESLLVRVMDHPLWLALPGAMVGLICFAIITWNTRGRVEIGNGMVRVLIHGVLREEHSVQGYRKMALRWSLYRSRYELTFDNGDHLVLPNMAVWKHAAIRRTMKREAARLPTQA